MSTTHKPIEELDFFLIYEEVAHWAWAVVEKWPHYIRDDFGVQLTSAADSVGANLVEADGRYASADGIRFLVIARGSAREARLWISRAVRRKLVPAADGEAQISKLEKATKLLNLFINYRRKAFPRVVREPLALYGDGEMEDSL